MIVRSPSRTGVSDLGEEKVVGSRLETQPKGDPMRATAGRRTVTMVLALGTILGMASWVPRAAAAESERAMKWQGSIPITFTSGASYDSEFTSVDVSDDLGWGFGF